MTELKAIEEAKQVSRAAKDWERKFADNAVEIGRRNGPVLWHQDLKVWATFVAPKSRAWRPGAHLNYFGYRPYSFRNHTTVEISPPTQGRNTNLQGMFAVDENGDRWVLHQGRLHPGATRISQKMFGAVAPPDRRVEVIFKDGHRTHYFRVANLDASSFEVQRQVADFVHLCDHVRSHYIEGPSVAGMQKTVEDLEFELTAEPTDGFEYGGRSGGRAEHRHGIVHEGLVRELQKYGLKVGNRRVGRHGPDLHSDGQPPMLFEIKSSRTSACLQQAVGQLYIYEQALNRPHSKVAVVPGPISSDWLKIMSTLKIDVLEFRFEKGKAVFDHADLDRVIGQSIAGGGVSA